jgi:oligopeptide/dipeptide ABC transporter ATP-binding protein
LLLSAVPDSEHRGADETHSTADEPKNALIPPAGCSFQPRCPISEDRCQQSGIALVKAGEDHLVRCWKTAPNGSYQFFS